MVGCLFVSRKAVEKLCSSPLYNCQPPKKLIFPLHRYRLTSLVEFPKKMKKKKCKGSVRTKFLFFGFHPYFSKLLHTLLLRVNACEIAFNQQ